VLAEILNRRAELRAARQADHAAQTNTSSNLDSPYKVVACVHCPMPTAADVSIPATSNTTVYISVDINAAGQVTEVAIASSSGHAELDAAALKLVKDTWQFEPLEGGAVDQIFSVALAL
jgi:TonB family protein